MLRYDIGDLARLAITYRDPDSGQLKDPSALVATVTAPDGTVTTWGWPSATNLITKDATGQFHLSQNVDQAGHWTYDFTASGALVDYSTGDFAVDAAGTSQTRSDLRDAVRRLIQDGRATDGTTFNVVRLEDLSDQIPALATPTQTEFLVRFTSLPTQGLVSVFVVPGTLRAYLDNSSSPTVPSVDVDANGNFTLPTAPTSDLQVTYGWQFLQDADVDSYVEQARSWLALYGDITLIPDGLSNATVQYAAGQALLALARKCTLADARAGDAEMSFAALAKGYQAQGAALLTAATASRDDFYKRAGATAAPAVSGGALAVPGYQPRR